MDLKSFFTPEAIAATLTRLPDLKTPVMDLIFTDRINHPFPYVGVEDLGLPQENVPLVRREAQSYPVTGPSLSVSIIEPQPVKPSTFIPQSTLNDMVNMFAQRQQQVLDSRHDRLRRACRTTAEALCIQALTGTISYPLSLAGGGLGTYTVAYGSIGDASSGVTKKFDAEGAKISDVVKGLEAIVEALKEKSDGNDVIYGCGFDVFSVLCDLVGAQSNASVAMAMSDGISIGGGIKINLMNYTYKNLKTKAKVPVIPAKNILAIDRQAGHKLIYAALDSLDAGLQAMPYFATFDQMKDPAGVKIIGESKPLPVVNVNGIVKAQVLT